MDIRGCIYGYKICFSVGLKEDFSFLGVCGWGLRFIFDKILNRGGGCRIYIMYKNF